MKPSHFLRRVIATGLAAICFLAATPRSYALFGVGDIVFDPAVFSAIEALQGTQTGQGITEIGQFTTQIGQGSAEISQMIQDFQQASRMEQRLGSMANVHSWQGILRQFALLQISRQLQTMYANMGAQGGRLSTFATVNPAVSCMLRGRNVLAQMQTNFQSGAGPISQGAWLSGNAYFQGQLNGVNLAGSLVASTNVPGSLNVTAAASIPGAYGAGANINVNAALSNGLSSANASMNGAIAGANGVLSSTPVQTGSGGSAGTASAGSVNVPTAASSTGDLAATAAMGTNNADPGLLAMNATSAAGAANAANASGPGAQAIAGSGAVAVDNPNLGLLNTIDNPLMMPTDVNGNKITDPSKMTVASMNDALSYFDAAKLQELDAADLLGQNSTAALEEDKEMISQNGMMGPEPYLQHLIAQNDTQIQLQRLKIKQDLIDESRRQAKETYELQMKTLASSPARETNVARQGDVDTVMVAANAGGQ